PRATDVVDEVADEALRALHAPRVPPPRGHGSILRKLGWARGHAVSTTNLHSGVKVSCRDRRLCLDSSARAARPSAARGSIAGNSLPGQIAECGNTARAPRTPRLSYSEEPAPRRAGPPGAPPPVAPRGRSDPGR